MLAKNAAARRQPVLDQVVVELDHSHRRLLDPSVDNEDAGQLRGEKEDLQDDRDHLPDHVQRARVIV